MDFDKALSKVDGYSRWHLTVFVLLGISSFMPLTIQNIGIVFIGWEPPYHCKIPANRTFNGTIPVARENAKDINRCAMYVDENSNQTEPCTEGFLFDNDNYTTIVTQFNLVCQSNYLAEMSQTIYMLGGIVADLFTSYITDRFGRKWMHIISHVLIGGVGIAEAFSGNYITFVILRTLVGMISQMATNSGLTYLMEMFSSKKRAFAGIGLEFTFVGVYLLPCLIAYFTKNWRNFQIIGSSLSFIWIVYAWLIPESVSWLTAKKRYREADEALNFMASWNTVKINKKDIQLFGQHETKSGNCPGGNSSMIASINPESKLKVPLTDIFTDPILRKHLIVCNFLWFSNAIIYYGLIFSTPSLGENRFLTYSIMGLIEIPANIITLIAVQKLGRKKPLMVFYMLAGIPLLINIFISKLTENGTEMSVIIFLLVILAKFGITGSFSIMLLYVKELFPTTLRSSSTAWCSIFGGVGAMVAPFMAYAVKHVFWIPNALFAMMSILASLSVLLLPETKDKPLPLTTAELYVVYYGNNSASKCSINDNDKQNQRVQ